MSISSRRDVAAPAARVHDLLTDVGSWRLRSPHVVSVEPAGGRVGAAWSGRVRPWFGPATTLRVTAVRPDGGYSWRTTALGHRLDHDHLVVASGDGACAPEFRATVHRPLAPLVERLVERLVSRLSASGQRRRTERLALLAEHWQRRP